MTPAGPLPDLYERWIYTFLGAPLPVEVRATCSDCAMAEPNAGTCGNEVVFRADTKCCTFMPELPNYLAGAILSDDSPEAREGRSLFECGAERSAIVNPLGVFPTPGYAASFNLNQSNFTHRGSLLCPYYMKEEGGLCGIWRYRNGRCATWFCKHERGAIGVQFWLALDHLLSAIESSLSIWCLLQLDPGSRALLELSSGARNTAFGPSAWGTWAGKEREYYRGCWRLVSPLSWDEVMQIAGPGEHLLARTTRDAFAIWQQSEIPERICPGEFQTERIDEFCTRIWAHSIFDPLDLETRVLDVLSLFDGSPTEESLERIERERGISIGRELLQQLCDARVLVKA